MVDKRGQLIEKIATYYRNKYKGNAESEIQKCQFTAIEHLDDKNCMLKVKRPGILIGPRGSNITELQKFLGIHVFVVEDASTDVCDELMTTGIFYLDYETDDDLSF